MPSPLPSDGRAAAQSTLDALVAFYERLTPQDLPALAWHYAPEARFRDPFHEVRGVAAITRIFERMFATLEAPRFVVTGRYWQEGGDRAVLAWDFRFRFRGEARERGFSGLSELAFDAQGRVESHLDHWDAAGAVYEQLPLLGGLLRWVRRRIAGG